MPKFTFNKLIRDKLRAEYERDGQKAVYRVLTSDDHKRQLIRKIIEEASELSFDKPVDQIAGEIADIQQAVDDLAALTGTTKSQIQARQQEKFDKKGGFAGGTFVETLELADSDKWVGYYRERPDVFPETK